MSIFEKPEGISWDPASVELPPIPMLPPGADAMSMTISALLPTLAAPLEASVASLKAKETMFSGKVGAAQAAYEGADQSGGQSVGQLSSMLGQVGQMGQQAGQAGQGAGGGSGMFGQMMQQAMQAAQSFGQQGGGSQGGGSSQGGAPQGGGAPASMGQGQAGGAPAQAPRDENPGDKQDSTGAREDREAQRHEAADRPPTEQAPAGASGPEPGSHGVGPAPVESPRHGGEDDLARRM
jgi:hypothetical protein